MTPATAILAGALAGVHAATWGAYKDSVYEGFSWRKYVRSILIGATTGVLLAPLVGLADERAAGFVMLFGCAYVGERAVFELYKTFLRQEDQSKYHIPMQFHVFGRVVESRMARILAGVVLVLLIAAIVVGVTALERASWHVPRLATAAVAGTIAGLLSAVMGAWKDAPIEGFETFKFLRSPAIALGYALLLAPLTPALVPLGIAALGYTIASIETYKTFFTGRAPGKFAGKPILHPEFLRTRRRLVPLFAMIWLAVMTTAFAAWRADAVLRMFAQLKGT